MGAKNKLKKFSEMAAFPNVVQAGFDEVYQKSHYLKGKWAIDFFKNNNPIVLELGCGKGEYTVGLARKFTGKNFLGIDIKGARMWKGASDALDGNLKNAGFLRTRIEMIQSFFAPGEVSEIWITFPDPQIKRLRAKKRLTSAGFLNLYGKFLKHGGVIHLKTDSEHLYEFTRSVIKINNLPCIEDTSDLYKTGIADDILSIKTHYEALFTDKGFTIKYLKFTLLEDVVLVNPPELENPDNNGNQN